ncbi:MAG: hypothetical protein J6S71_01160 [Clostridia bacterium]|nr:hypothetical protein [Clostridia bacterium]
MINKELAQKHFDLAYRAYLDAKETVKELTTVVQLAAPNFSFDIAMSQFDLILQGILLRTAVEDGYFLDEERQFIEKITDYADIMSYFNNKGIPISWDLFNQMSDEQRKDISLKMVVLLTELAEGFVTPFAMIDSVLPKDYCEVLTETMGIICLALAKCDGDANQSAALKSEGLVAIVLIDKIIKEKWREIEEKTKNN